MAIVSIQRIINTSDRIALDMEYKNIINNLKLGNIEADKEIIDLYQELLNVISAKTLSQEAAARLQEHYNRFEREVIANSLLSVRAYGTDPITIGATFAASCASSYFAYQAITKLPKQILDEKLYKIDVQEREGYNALQTKLLNSSWRLMRQYKLPDEYRITQEGVNDLFRAVNEPDSSKSLNMLKTLEDEFKIYPPYWIYRAKAAQSLANESEAAKCFDEFDKVWRPVLRNDPFKLEAAKYRVIQAMKSGKNSEALSHIAIVRENTLRSDWTNNLFAGVAYFVLGEKEKGINCVEVNVNFDAEKEISGVVLAQIKEGKLDASALPAELKKLIGLSAIRLDIMIALAHEGDIEAQLMLGKMYADGEVVKKDFRESLKYYKMAAEQGYEIAIFAIAALCKQGGPNLRQDYGKAVEWLKKLADNNNEAAILEIADMYRYGDPNIERFSKR